MCNTLQNFDGSLMKFESAQAASFPITSSLEELKPFLSEAEWSQILKCKNRKLQLQRATAYHQLKELLQLSEPHRWDIDYDSSGKPHIQESEFDISISHKEERVFVGTAPQPCRVGVDMEKLGEIGNPDLMANSFLTPQEREELNLFLKREKLPFSFGVSICWSVKESFAKCLSMPFFPKCIEINSITKDKEVTLFLNPDIEKRMEENNWFIKKVSFRIEIPWVYSVSVIERKSHSSGVK